MSDEDTHDPLPSIYGHCELVYNKMRETAKPIEVEEGVRVMIWEGFLTRLINDDLGLAVPYYSKIRDNLMRMDCIRQLRRGGGNSPSQWEMRTKPTAELFRTKQPRIGQKLDKMAQLEGQIRDLGGRLEKLEKLFENMIVIEHALEPDKEEPNGEHVA